MGKKKRQAHIEKSHREDNNDRQPIVDTVDGWTIKETSDEYVEDAIFHSTTDRCPFVSDKPFCNPKICPYLDSDDTSRQIPNKCPIH